MHVGTALAVRCNARAASATDLRARYLAPLARCALLPQLLDFIVSLTVIHIPAINRRANHARTIPSTR